VDEENVVDPEDDADESAEPMVVKQISDEILKSAPEAVRKALTDMQKATDMALAKAAVAEDALRKERDDRADEASVSKARDQFANLGIDAEMVGPALRRLAGLDADLAKSVEDVLVAANAKVESADIFAEIGKSASGTIGTAYEQATSLAKAAVSSGKADTFAQALTDVFSAEPHLYSQYLSDQQGK
jgi:3-methyladenine DNA glycosylase AlkD